MSRGSDANGDTAFGWRPTSGSAEDAADGDGDAADGDGAREDTEAASGSVAEAASGSVAEAAPTPSGSGSEDNADPTSSGSEDVRASELEELSGLVSATEVSTIGLSLGASSGEGEAGGLAGELDMTEPTTMDIQNMPEHLDPWNTPVMDAWSCIVLWMVGGTEAAY